MDCQTVEVSCMRFLQPAFFYDFVTITMLALFRVQVTKFFIYNITHVLITSLVGLNIVLTLLQDLGFSW
jgi:hypothetical protein